MTKEIKSFELRQGEECTELYIDGKLYQNAGIRQIIMTGRGGIEIEVFTVTDPVLTFNNSVVENIDKFFIFNPKND